MTQEQWNKEVRHALIDREITWTELASSIGFTTAWIQATMRGEGSQQVVDKVSDFLGIKKIKYERNPRRRYERED